MQRQPLPLAHVVHLVDRLLHGSVLRTVRMLRIPRKDEAARNPRLRAHRMGASTKRPVRTRRAATSKASRTFALRWTASSLMLALRMTSVSSSFAAPTPSLSPALGDGAISANQPQRDRIHDNLTLLRACGGKSSPGSLVERVDVSPVGDRADAVGDLPSVTSAPSIADSERGQLNAAAASCAEQNQCSSRSAPQPLRPISPTLLVSCSSEWGGGLHVLESNAPAVRWHRWHASVQKGSRGSGEHHDPSFAGAFASAPSPLKSGAASAFFFFAGRAAGAAGAAPSPANAVSRSFVLVLAIF